MVPVLPLPPGFSRALWGEGVPRRFAPCYTPFVPWSPYVVKKPGSRIPGSDLTPEQKATAGLLRSAIEDLALEKLEVREVPSGLTEQKKEARTRLRELDLQHNRDRASAIRFVFDPGFFKFFSWICWGLGYDPKVVREMVRPRVKG